MARKPAAFLALGLLGALSLAAARAQQVPEFPAGVAVVGVPIFVTDKDGRAVGGLSADDFEIRDEGKRVEIVSFYEIDAETPATIPVRGRLAPLARRQFLLLFDLSFSTPGGIVRSREAALDFVSRKLGPADLAGVATFSANRGVTLLVGFTGDRAQVAAAIAGLGLIERERSADRLNLVYGVEDLPISTTNDSLLGGREVKEQALLEELRDLTVRYQRSEEALYRQKVEVLIDGFEQLGAALRSIHGRTQVVYLSSGFQESVLTGATGEAAAANAQAVMEGRLWDVQSDTYFGDAEIRNYLDRVMKTLAAADVIVHSLDVSGMAARGDAAAAGRHDDRVSGQESLSQIATLSGGRFIKSANDVATGLQEVLDATRRYYLVAFEAPAAGKPGRFHDLKVKLKRGGLRASHRTGYFEAEPFAERTALARQLEAAEAITKGGVAGELALEALPVPYRDAEGHVLLPVVLELGGEALLQGAGETLPLEVYGYAFDAEGVVRDSVAINATLDLAKVGDRVRRAGVQAHAIFSLPAGRHELRFLVRDAASGRKGVRWLDVTVPEFSERVVLYPALLMSDPQEWLILPAASRNTKAPGYPFHVGEESFTPRLDVRLANGKTAAFCLLAWTGGASYGAGDAFEIGAQLFDASGNGVRLGRLQLARQAAETDGFRRIVLNVTPEAVPPGEYTLRVRLKDPATGAVSEADRAVRF